MHAGAHTQVNMCVEAKGHLQVSVFRYYPPLLDTASLTGLKPTKWAEAGQPVSFREPPVPASQGWDYKCLLLCPGQLMFVSFSTGVGIKFRSSCRASTSLAELSPSPRMPLKGGELGAGEMAQWSKAEYWVQFPAQTRWLTAVCKSTPKGSAPSSGFHGHRHTWRQNTHTHKNIFFF